MGALDRRLDILRRLRPAERLAALAAALPHAGAEEREALALALVELAAGAQPSPTRDEAVRTLLVQWLFIPAGARQLALAAARGRWREAARDLDPATLGSHGSSIAELAIDSADPAIAALLPAVLDSGDAPSVAGAAQALLALAVRLSGEDDPAMLGLERLAPSLRPTLDRDVEPWSEADARDLLSAIARGVEAFESHRRKELLLAAVLLLERPGARSHFATPLAELVVNEDAAAGRTLRYAMRRARAPVARRRAWLWLRDTSVAAACMERIARAPTVADHAAVLSLGHLAIAPAREAKLRLVPLPTRAAPSDGVPPGVEPGGRRLLGDGPAPDRVALQLLGFAARRQAPRFVASLDADDAVRDLALDAFLLDPDPLARLAAARVVSASAAKDFCFDGCEAVARSATIAVSACGVAESGRLRAGDAPRRCFAAALARSPHPAARRIGAEDVERLTRGACSPSGALAALRTYLVDSSGFVDWVRDTVRGDDAVAAVTALMTARRIRVVAEIEPLALSIIRDSLTGRESPPARLVATAVACIGDLRGGRAVGVLAECLGRHPDPRVRANAAEAIVRCRRADPFAGSLERSLRDEHHRVRASAVRSLLVPPAESKVGAGQVAGPVEALICMLRDDRSAHRLAGVWVVQRSLHAGMRGFIGPRWGEIATRVRWLASGDESDGVRSRAEAVARRLDAAIAGLGPRTVGSLS